MNRKDICLPVALCVAIGSNTIKSHSLKAREGLIGFKKNISSVATIVGITAAATAFSYLVYKLFKQDDEHLLESAYKAAMLDEYQANILLLNALQTSSNQCLSNDIETLMQCNVDTAYGINRYPYLRYVQGISGKQAEITNYLATIERRIIKLSGTTTNTSTKIEDLLIIRTKLESTQTYLSRLKIWAKSTVHYLRDHTIATEENRQRHQYCNFHNSFVMYEPFPILENTAAEKSSKPPVPSPTVTPPRKTSGEPISTLGQTIIDTFNTGPTHDETPSSLMLKNMFL